MPFGYAGGPVVAEAMKDLFAADSFDYTDGYPLSLLSATVGMFAGVILGAILVNLAPLSTPLGGARGAPPGRTATGDGMCCASSATAAARPRTTLVRRLRKSMADLAATAPDSDHYPSRVRPAATAMTCFCSPSKKDELGWESAVPACCCGLFVPNTNAYTSFALAPQLCPADARACRCDASDRVRGVS